MGSLLHVMALSSPIFIKGQKYTIYNYDYQMFSKVLLGGLHRINGRKRRDVMNLQFEL